MYKNFKLYGTWVILRECTTYSRTDSGKSWRCKPDEVRREVVDAESCDAYGEYDIDLLLEVQELEDRVNYAWQDNEYNANYRAETWNDGAEWDY